MIVSGPITCRVLKISGSRNRLNPATCRARNKQNGGQITYKEDNLSVLCLITPDLSDFVLLSFPFFLKGSVCTVVDNNIFSPTFF